MQRFCQLDEGCLRQLSKSLMRAAVNQMDLGARAGHRMRKLSRTITDLAGGENDQGGAPGGGSAPVQSK